MSREEGLYIGRLRKGRGQMKRINPNPYSIITSDTKRQRVEEPFNPRVQQIIENNKRSDKLRADKLYCRIGMVFDDIKEAEKHNKLTLEEHDILFDRLKNELGLRIEDFTGTKDKVIYLKDYDAPTPNNYFPPLILNDERIMGILRYADVNYTHNNGKDLILNTLEEFCTEHNIEKDTFEPYTKQQKQMSRKLHESERRNSPQHAR